MPIFKTKHIIILLLSISIAYYKIIFKGIKWLISFRYLFQITQINEKVYLGSMIDGMNYFKLKSYKIKYILNCAQYIPNFFPSSFEYKNLPLRDSYREDIIKYMYETLNFIINSKGNIYIHCIGGISRSASFFFAYLIFTDNMSFDQALKIVNSKRSLAEPNGHFTRQLKSFEDFIRKNNYDLETLKNISYEQINTTQNSTND